MQNLAKRTVWYSITSLKQWRELAIRPTSLLSYTDTTFKNGVYRMVLKGKENSYP